MYKKNTKTNKTNYSSLLLFFFFILIAGIGLFVYLAREDTPSNNDGLTVNTIDYGPPSEEEKVAGDKQKDLILEQEKNLLVPDGANVIIVDSSQYSNEIEVRAFASNIIADGTCKVSFSKDAYLIEKEVPAYADASSSPCIALSVPRSEFQTSGTWEVTVQYFNSNIKGSASSTIEVE